MKNKKSRTVLGGLIILVGVLALMVNIGILGDWEELLGGLLLLLGGLFFLNLYHQDRSKWWPLLPGAVLAVLGIGVIFNSYVPHASDMLGAAFLYTIFAVFAFVFTRDRSGWWAVIPAGVCFTLGTVVLVDTFHWLNSDLNGVVFFLGLGLTFYYLWSLRQNVENVDWAIWPAGVLLGLALLVYINEVNWIRDDFIFPLLIIVVGVIIIISGTRKKK